MSPINILTTAIDSLWLWTYGLVAGWGITFTLVVVALIILLVRTINLQRRVDRLEHRLITAERDYNLSVNNWKSK